jgi:hypothetical protein
VECILTRLAHHHLGPYPMHVERAAWVGAQKCILYYINMHQGHSAAHPALQLASWRLASSFSQAASSQNLHSTSQGRLHSRVLSRRRALIARWQQRGIEITMLQCEPAGRRFSRVEGTRPCLGSRTSVPLHWDINFSGL